MGKTNPIILEVLFIYRSNHCPEGRSSCRWKDLCSLIQSGDTDQVTGVYKHSGNLGISEGSRHNSPVSEEFCRDCLTPESVN